MISDRKIYNQMSITDVRRILGECHVALSDLRVDKRLPDELYNTVVILDDLIREIHLSEWHIRTF